MSLSFSTVPPLTDEVLPPVLDVPRLEEVDVGASPEWFGDGWNAFRQIVVRRELAQIVVEASPREFRIQEVA
jgi:hypothetical protein